MARHDQTEPYALTTTYTYVRSLERDHAGTRDVPLTPRHSAGLVGMWEREDVGRVGLELYYTGTQRLEANPYADRSEPYVILGLLAEKQFGPVRLFVNGENLTGVRQTKWQPLDPPGSRTGRTLDRRRVGAARGPQRERRGASAIRGLRVALPIVRWS